MLIDLNEHQRKGRVGIQRDSTLKHGEFLRNDYQNELIHLRTGVLIADYVD